MMLRYLLDLELVAISDVVIVFPEVTDVLRCSIVFYVGALLLCDNCNAYLLHAGP